PRLQPEPRVRVRGPNLLFVVAEHLVDRVADDVDAPALYPLAQEVLPAARGVGHQHIAAVVDDAAVDLLGHADVVAAVAGLHLDDGDAEALGDDRRGAAVRVA